MRQLQSLLDRARSQHDSLNRQVNDQAAELSTLRSTVVSSSRQLASSEQELDRVKAELRVQSAAFQDMQAEREATQLEVHHVADDYHAIVNWVFSFVSLFWVIKVSCPDF